MKTEHRRVGKLLLTGANGFVGQHVLAAAARGEFDADVIQTPPAGWDIRDPASVSQCIGTCAPDTVLHLAAQSFVPRSFEDPRETFDINVFGTLNLLEALKSGGFRGRLLYVSSGDVYGRVPDDALPVDERRQAEPRNPYAASKIAAEQLCLAWHRAEGLDVVIARPFNHVGPGQGRKFVLPALASQAVAIAEKRQPATIEAGYIDVTRDFTDVRDIVGAYAAMLARGHAGATYVVASGIERSIRAILSEMCRLTGIDPEIRIDSNKLRPAEQRRMVASSALLNSHTGWQPRVPFETTLQSIIQDASRES